MTKKVASTYISFDTKPKLRGPSSLMKIIKGRTGPKGIQWSRQTHFSLCTLQTVYGQDLKAQKHTHMSTYKNHHLFYSRKINARLPTENQWKRKQLDKPQNIALNSSLGHLCVFYCSIVLTRRFKDGSFYRYFQFQIR